MKAVMPKLAGDVEFVAETLLPTHTGFFRVRAYRDHRSNTEPVAIIHGAVEGRTNVVVRVHDECMTSEVLGSLKCDCKSQLDHAMAYIQEHEGVVIYLRQEGRGIGLANKVAAYHLQETGLDTVDANRALGLPDDAREYHAARAILDDLGLNQIALITNNPRKIDLLRSEGIEISRRIPSVMAGNPHSAGYLTAKSERMKHLF